MDNTNNNGNGRGIFLAVVGIATLIVTAIGATFAYFVASATGNTNKVAANSASFTLSMTESYDIRTQLIPVTEAIMKQSFGQTSPNDCKVYSAAGGSTQYDACSTYTFTVTNTSTAAQTIFITLTTTYTNFGNLYYMIVDGADNSSATPTVRKAAGAVPAAGTNNAAKNIVNDTLAATNGSHTYTLILWINEKNSDQTSADSGKRYTGTITVSSGTGTSNITGVINQVTT